MRDPPTLENAQTLALKVLGFLANSPETMERLMQQSGLDSATIRERAAEPDFLLAVVDFLMANEDVMIDFCQVTRIEPKAVQLASQLLSGV